MMMVIIDQQVERRFAENKSLSRLLTYVLSQIILMPCVFGIHSSTVSNFLNANFIHYTPEADNKNSSSPSFFGILA